MIAPGLHVGPFQLNVEWQGSRVLPGPRRRLTDPAELAEATTLLLVPENNVAAAYELWTESGWAPWSCRP